MESSAVESTAVPVASSTPWTTRRVVFLCVFAGLIAGAVGAVGGSFSTLLLRYDARAISASFAARAGIGNLNLRAARDFNVNAHHVRMISGDGNFELEHGSSVPTSALNSYRAGSGVRTPIQIGDRDQDVLSLLVSGAPEQTNDLQQWSTGGTSLLAVDGRGRLRFGRVTVWVASRGGRIVLYARTSGGPARVLSETR
jgi:hypothetical protein